MTDLILKIPEKLHQKLSIIAEQKRVSLDEYIINILNSQINNNYQVKIMSETDIESQINSFQNLIQELGEIEDQEIKNILSQRDIITEENELTPEIKNKLLTKIQKNKLP